MKLPIVIGCLVMVICLVGCGEPQSDLTKEDKVKMDKLFREGVKPGNPPAASGQKSAAPGPRGSSGQPINAADQ